MTSKEKQKIIKIAEHVRACVQAAYAQMNEWKYDVTRLEASCVVASYHLAIALCAAGFDATFVVGWFNHDDHCWVQLDDGTIVDITVTQFDIGLPGVYVTMHDTRYDRNEKYMRLGAVYMAEKWCVEEELPWMLRSSHDALMKLGEEFTK